MNKYCYRPQRSCKGFVFTGVCLSTRGKVCSWGCLVPGKRLCSGGCLVLGGVCSGGCLVLGGVCSQWVPGPRWVGIPACTEADTPRQRRLLLRMVRILLECILVLVYCFIKPKLFIIFCK